jgi:hypothetical protein
MLPAHAPHVAQENWTSGVTRAILRRVTDLNPREQFLAGLAATLARGEDPHEATRPPAGAGIVREEHPWGTVLTLDPPADARDVARALGVERPVAVSGDVHQESWSMLEAGEPIPDPYGARIASSAPHGLEIALAARPPGPLPDVSSGASPAYDLLECPSEVTRITVPLGG